MKKILLLLFCLSVAAPSFSAWIPYQMSNIVVSGNSSVAYAAKTFSKYENLAVLQIDQNNASYSRGLDVRIAAVANPNTYTAGAAYQTLYASPVGYEKVFFLRQILTGASTQTYYFNTTCTADVLLEARTYRYVP